MSELQSLEQQIQQRLKSADEKNRAQQGNLQATMAELDRRGAQFERMADELLADMIDPRMQTLARCFDNAELLERHETGRHSSLRRFNHTAEYPASVKLTLSVAHDAETETFFLVYHLEILPIFFKFEGHDETALSLNDPDRQRVGDWVDQKLLAFVDSYLQLAETDQYQQRTHVIDPVCGMQFRKRIVTAAAEHVGQKYLFCSEGCREKFTVDPQR